MSDSKSDIQRIGATFDSNGDEIPQDHPIENPGQNGGDGGDPVGEPHPDEPGAAADAEETSAPDGG